MGGAVLYRTWRSQSFRAVTDSRAAAATWSTLLCDPGGHKIDVVGLDAERLKCAHT